MSEELMKFRPHRGSLTDAMAEAVTLECTKEALHAHLVKTCYGFHSGERITVKRYAGEDLRTGWKETFIVISQCGVLGFCDRNVEG